MAAEPRCPVCGRPAGQRPACAECGWVLHTKLLAGGVTPAMQQEFDTQLSRASKAQAERDERTLAAALGEVIADVRPNRETAVIEVGPDRIDMVFAYLDAAESPQVRDGRSTDWSKMLPKMPASEHDRHTQLSDGVPGVSEEQVAKLVKDRLPAVGGAGALVVCRPAGWQVLEAAAETAARATRPRARLLRVSGQGDVSVRTLLAGLAAKAPLRRPYYLLTAMVDPRTGEVRLRPKQLFAAGAKPGAVATVPLRRMPGDVADTTLAIFAGNGVADWSAATPLTMFQVPVPTKPEPQVRAVLTGPGRVEIAEPPGAKLHTGTWAQVCRLVPSRVATTASPVDLVCAIDLSGPVEVVAQRKELVDDLIRLLDNEYRQRGQFRVAIVTCTDHAFGDAKGNEYIPVTDASELGAAEDALTWLAEQEGVNMRNKYSAPVEDLLHEAFFLLERSASAHRRPRLLTLAGRLPHPYPQRAGRPIACPRHFSWERIVRELDGAHVSYAIVADSLPGPRDPDRGTWTRLGPAGLYALPTATAAQVAESLGLLAGRGQRIPIPMSDDN
jgi:hypothetical protein